MFGLAGVAALAQALLMLFLPPTPHFLMLQQREAEAERVIVKLKLSSNPRQKVANIRQSIQAEESPSSPICFCCGAKSASSGTQEKKCSNKNISRDFILPYWSKKFKVKKSNSRISRQTTKFPQKIDNK